MGMFDNLGEDESNSPISILKDLLSKKDIEMKTDVNIDQIRILVQIKLYYLLNEPDLKTSDAVQQALTYYLELLASSDRKSRTEITEAIKELKMQPDQGILPALGGKK